jgi:hypothetical protein
VKRIVEALILVVASVAVSACGASERQEAGTPATIFARFAEAAAARDIDGMWELLSERTKARITRAEFARHASALHEREGAVASGRVVLNVRIGDGLAVAALAGGEGEPGSRASVLRLEEGTWRVQLSELDLIYGASFLEFGVNTGGLSAAVEARTWVDGKEARVRAVRRKPSLVQWFEVVPRHRLGPAREHSMVVFARAGDRSGAIASTSSAAVGSISPSPRLTEQGHLLRNFEALLFQIFGTREVSIRWREGLNFSCAGACAPNSDYQWYRLVFERPRGTTLHLSSRKIGRRLVAPTGYVEPVRVRGQLVACDRAETRFLVGYKTFESFTLGCVEPR